ncbi:hypothetical protein [Mitsuokella sp. WILCCON 0060]|uniref:hypothetical protein n=1 Tax=Mitsuokella sp. WILCCON 0060 TaxID=3345341 RepID=UPI003F1B2969
MELPDVSYDEIVSYLDEVANLIKRECFSFASNRDKNEELLEKYLLSERDVARICTELTPEDFCQRVRNVHPRYKHEILYIFRKELLLQERFGNQEDMVGIYIKFNCIRRTNDKYLIIISFHEEEHPLKLYADINKNYHK